MRLETNEVRTGRARRIVRAAGASCSICSGDPIMGVDALFRAFMQGTILYSTVQHSTLFSFVSPEDKPRDRIVRIMPTRFHIVHVVLVSSLEEVVLQLRLQGSWVLGGYCTLWRFAVCLWTRETVTAMASPR